jgi:hypothetical protein
MRRKAYHNECKDEIYCKKIILCGLVLFRKDSSNTISGLSGFATMGAGTSPNPSYLAWAKSPFPPELGQEVFCPALKNTVEKLQKGYV